MRHCITKLAHLHFPATKTYGERIVQLGEDPARVHVVGAAGLEAIAALRPLSREELALSLGVELRRPLLAVTFHPASLRSADARAESDELAAALSEVDGTVIVTLPNDDPGGLAVREAMLALEARAPHVRTYAALGQHRYLSLLAHADAVVGNSSSAIIEAPSFKLPVVDVGDRQRGRTRADEHPQRAAGAGRDRRGDRGGARARVPGVPGRHGEPVRRRPRVRARAGRAGRRAAR